MPPTFAHPTKVTRTSNRFCHWSCSLQHRSTRHNSSSCGRTSISDSPRSIGIQPHKWGRSAPPVIHAVHNATKQCCICGTPMQCKFAATQVTQFPLWRAGYNSNRTCYVLQLRCSFYSCNQHKERHIHEHEQISRHIQKQQQNVDPRSRARTKEIGRRDLRITGKAFLHTFVCYCTHRYFVVEFLIRSLCYVLFPKTKERRHI